MIVRIKDRAVGDGQPVYVVGEIACGHQGDFTQATKLIDAVADAGADAAQLQIFDPRANVAPGAPIFDLLQTISFTPRQWSDLAAHVRERKVHLSLFVYDEPSLELGLSLSPDMLKLNSSELSNPALVVGAAESGLPFTLGTGASTLDEVGKAVSWIVEAGAGDRVILMHGVQNFPTTPDLAQISRIPLLKHAFGLPVMYADHTPGDDPLAQTIDMVALGMGACMVEKHLVLDRSQKGVDWQAALEPEEFARYVRNMRIGWSAIGDPAPKPFTNAEKRYRRFQKKSLVSARDLAAGNPLSAADFRYLRVQGEREGISPAEAIALAGWSLRRAISENEQILMTDLMPPARPPSSGA